MITSLDHPFATDKLVNAERTLCHQSIAMLRAGQYDKALDLSLKPSRTCPAHPLPCYLQAWSLVYLGCFEEEKRAIDAALAVQPKSVDAWFLDCGIFIMSQPTVTIEYPCSLDANGNPESELRKAPEPASFLPELPSMDVLKASSWTWMLAQLKERGPRLKSYDILKLATVASLPWTATDFMSLFGNTWWTDRGVQATELRLAERVLALDPYNAAALVRKASHVMH